MVNPALRDIAFDQLGIKHGIGHCFNKFYERKGRVEIPRKQLIELIMDMYNAGYYQGLTTKVPEINKNGNERISGTISNI